MTMIPCRSCGHQIHESALACPNCGAPNQAAAPAPAVSANMVFCSGCGQQISAVAAACPKCGSPQQASTPQQFSGPQQAMGAVPARIAVDNGVVWVLAFAPLIGTFVEGFLKGFVEGVTGTRTTNEYWFITLALNIGLCILDAQRLGKAGFDTRKFKGFTWLVPVYMYKRARAVGDNLAYFIIWLVCFFLTILF